MLRKYRKKHHRAIVRQNEGTNTITIKGNRPSPRSETKWEYEKKKKRGLSGDEV